jgi:hypothetical protein
MGIAAVEIDHRLAPSLPDGHLSAEAVRLVLTIGGAVAVLATAAHLLRIREFQMATAAFIQRVRPRPE